jgi:uncharacterized protein YkwD
MGEDFARGGTRTHGRRAALVAGLAAAGALARLGLGLAAAPAAEQAPRPIAAVQPVQALRGPGEPTLVTTTTAVPTTTVPAPTTVAPAEVADLPAPVTPPPAKVTPAPATSLEGWVRRTDLEDALFALHNEARVAAGLAPYAEQACLRSVAVGWARSMAERGVLEHNPDHPEQIVSCSDDVLVGENVGVGYEEAGGAAGVFDAFMASPHHRSNILDTDFQLIGIGVWSSPDGTIRVAVDFGLE